MAAKQVMDIQKVTSIDGGVSDEILRGWNDKKYESKEQNPTLNYDRSREHLNFEVGKLGKIIPIDKTTSIEDLVETEIRNRVSGTIRCTTNRALLIIFEGDGEAMRKMAFGDQPIDKSKGADNSGIVCQERFKQWARDIRKFVEDEFGEENVLKVVAHLDESTPHLHVVVTPILEGKLNAKKMIGGNSLKEASAHMRQIHDRLAAVNKKYGLERGDDVRITHAKHVSCNEYRKAQEGLLAMESKNRNAQNNLEHRQQMLEDCRDQIKESRKELYGSKDNYDRALAKSALLDILAFDIWYHLQNMPSFLAEKLYDSPLYEQSLDRNFFSDVLEVFVSGIGGSSASSGGGGGNNDLPKKRTDEDDYDFMKRCCRFVHGKKAAGRRLGKSKGTRL